MSYGRKKARSGFRAPGPAARQRAGGNSARQTSHPFLQITVIRLGERGTNALHIARGSDPVQMDFNR